GDAAQIEIPAVLLGGGLHLHEPLGIGDDFRGVQRLLDVVDEAGCLDAGVGSGQDPGCALSLILEGGDYAGVHRLPDEGGGLSQLHRGDHRPLPGSLLAGGVEYRLHSAFTVHLDRQDVSGDFDQVRVEDPLVPSPEGGGHLVMAQPETVPHQVVGLGDHLHVAVFDSVVDHLHVVAGASGAEPVRTWGAIGALGGYRLEEVDEVWPGPHGPPGHHRRTVASAFLAPGYPASDEVDPCGRQRLPTPGRVGVERVPPVHDDVARLQVRQQLVDDRVHRPAGRHHEDHLARSLQARHQLLDRVGGHDLGPVPLAGDELVGDRAGPVVDGDGCSIVGEVEGEIAAHDSETDEADVRWHGANGNSRLP